MKNKFKVGDKVRVKKFDKRPSTWNTEGHMDHLMGQIVEIVRDLGDRFYIWDEEYHRDWIVKRCEIEPVKNECIVIYRKDNEVIALNKATSEKTGARCCPSDEFDFMIGAKLAFDRLMRVPSTDTTPIKVGDVVIVVNSGRNFPTYNDFFVRNKIDLDIAARYVYDGHVDNGKRYKVLAIGEHEFGDTLCVITPNIGLSKGVHLIGIEGLKKC